MSLLHTIESVVKTSVTNQVSLLTSLFSVKCRLHKPVKDTYSEVYGIHSGVEKADFIEIDLLCIGDTSSPFDQRSVGTFQEGWVFTNDVRVEVGDQIDVIREDGRGRRYKIERKESIGTTDKVFSKFRLSAMGD